MSCHIEDGEELSMIGQPLKQGFRMVRLLAEHNQPSGNYKMTILKREGTGGPKIIGIELIPVKIVPVEDVVYQYQDEKHRDNLEELWADVFEANAISMTPEVTV